MLSYLCVIILALATFAYASKPQELEVFEYAKLFPSFTPTYSEDGRRAVFSVSEDHLDQNGKLTRTEFHYDILHPEGLVSLDRNPLFSPLFVEGVDCNKASQTTIKFRTRQAATDALNFLREQVAQQDKVVLTGGVSWACEDYNENIEYVQMLATSSIALKKVIVADTPLKIENERDIVITTRNAGLEDVFQDADVSFYSSAMPASTTFDRRKASMAEGQAVPKNAKRSFSSWWHRSWDKVKSIGKKVVDTVKDVYNGVKDLITGNVDTTTEKLKLGSLSWNMDTDSTASESQTADGVLEYISGQFNCSDCFLYFELDFIFELKMTDHHVDNLKMAVQGSANAVLEASIDATESLSWTHDFKIATIKGDPIVIMIGEVPLTLQFQLEIEVEFEIKIEFEETIVAKASSFGSVEYGFQVVDGKTSPISNHVFNREGKIQPISEKITAEVTVSLLPTLFLQIEELGGPYVTVKPYLELSGELYDSTGSDGCDSGVLLNLNLGLIVNLGGKIDIGDDWYTHTFPALTIYSNKWPLYTGCVKYSSLIPGGRQALPADNTVIPVNQTHSGNVWASRHTTQPGCDLEASFTMQQMDLDNNTGGYFAAALNIVVQPNASNPEKIHCVIQHAYYVADFQTDSTKLLTFTKVIGDADPYNMNWTMCSDGSQLVLHKQYPVDILGPGYFSGQFATDFSTFRLASGSNSSDITCLGQTFNLYRFTVDEPAVEEESSSSNNDKRDAIIAIAVVVPLFVCCILVAVVAFLIGTKRVNLFAKKDTAADASPDQDVGLKKENADEEA